MVSKNKSDLNGLLRLDCYAKCQEPIENIYQFGGLFVSKHEGRKVKEGLSLEQMMWANTVLANGRILGLVIYVGRETRMAMNSR